MELELNLVKLRKKYNDWRPFAESFFSFMRMRMGKVFQTGRFGQWASLTDYTRHMRTERIGYYSLTPQGGANDKGPIMVWTGNLARSFIKAKSKGSIANIRQNTSSGNSRIVYGSKLKTKSGYGLAELHQTNGTGRIGSYSFVRKARRTLPNIEVMWPKPLALIAALKLNKDTREVLGENLIGSSRVS